MMLSCQVAGCNGAARYQFSCEDVFCDKCVVERYSGEMSGRILTDQDTSDGECLNSACRKTISLRFIIDLSEHQNLEDIVAEGVEREEGEEVVTLEQTKEAFLKRNGISYFRVREIYEDEHKPLLQRAREAVGLA